MNWAPHYFRRKCLCDEFAIFADGEKLVFE